VSERCSDYTFHTPGGSSVPGKIDFNIYMTYPPEDLRHLLESEKDVEELKKIESALKQWERQYSYPGYPWKKVADQLRVVATELMKYSEIVGPAQNIPYYQDMETPEGYEGIMEGDRGQYDQDNMVRFDIPRQGIRPVRDIDTGEGGFLNPHDPIMTDVKPRGDGPSPEIEYPFPPTGGDVEGWPEGI
jgi:hypothetical protein